MSEQILREQNGAKKFQIHNVAKKKKIASHDIVVREIKHFEYLSHKPLILKH